MTCFVLPTGYQTKSISKTKTTCSQITKIKKFKTNKTTRKSFQNKTKQIKSTTKFLNTANTLLLAFATSYAKDSQLCGGGSSSAPNEDINNSQRNLFINHYDYKCDKSACLSPPQGPEDDTALGEKIALFVAESALASASAQPRVKLAANSFKLFTNTHNAAITSGDTAFDTFQDLRDDMVELIASSNEEQDIRNEARQIAQRRLGYVNKQFNDYHQYYERKEYGKAADELKNARDYCEELHDWHNHKQVDLKFQSRLPHAMSYCSLCGYVWSLSRGLEGTNDPVLERNNKNHLTDCAENVPIIATMAIFERMKPISKRIEFTQGGANGSTKQASHLLDWDGYYNHKGTDGGKPIVEWTGKGVCNLYFLALLGIIGPAAAMGQQVECLATDGLGGTIGHETDCCVETYRMGMMEKLLKLTTPIWQSAGEWFWALDTTGRPRKEFLADAQVDTNRRIEFFKENIYDL